MKAITARQALRIAKKLNLQIEDDGKTYYATNEAETELWSFESKCERAMTLNKVYEGGQQV